LEFGEAKLPKQNGFAVLRPKPAPRTFLPLAKSRGDQGAYTPASPARTFLPFECVRSAESLPKALRALGLEFGEAKLQKQNGFAVLRRTFDKAKMLGGAGAPPQSGGGEAAIR
jgi:hypothetical protein